MDKETLSNYGWIVICILVLTVMIALATPFGRFIEQAVQNTTQGLFDVNQSALDAAGITIEDNYIDQTNDANAFYDRVYVDEATGGAGIWHRDNSITLFHGPLQMMIHIPASDVRIEGNIISHTDPMCPTERQEYYVDWSGQTISVALYYYDDYDSTTGVYKSRTDSRLSLTRVTGYKTIEEWLASKS